jgi:hypothetical protein
MVLCSVGLDQPHPLAAAIGLAGDPMVIASERVRRTDRGSPPATVVARLADDCGAGPMDSSAAASGDVVGGVVALVDPATDKPATSDAHGPAANTTRE